jgi:Ca2+/Na+ antiporter
LASKTQEQKDRQQETGGTMIRRILAWIALIFLLLIITNILFIHVYVTESVTIFLLYVLVLYFGRNRGHETGGAGNDETDERPEAPETTGDGDNGKNTGTPEQLE